MADLTTEEIAEVRRLHAEAVECRKQFEGKITARMAGVFVSRLPALLDMAERCAKAEAKAAAYDKLCESQREQWLSITKDIVRAQNTQENA